MCPLGRGKTSEEESIVNEKAAALGLQVIAGESRSAYIMLEGELDKARPLLESLPGWTLGTLQTSRKV
jgi:hypothetical protein